MENLYKNKYRTQSLRIANWDYGQNGAYFITICTSDRVCYFGDIKNKKTMLSPLGVIADILWYEIKNHAKNCELGEFVVMPNHIHGILILNADATATATATVETRHALSLLLPIFYFILHGRQVLIHFILIFKNIHAVERFDNLKYFFNLRL